LETYLAENASASGRITAMPQSAITLTDTSTLTWETLDDWTRQMLRRYLQAVLEDEVTELLGRAKSQRRAPDEPPVYRNGHGEPRRLTTPVGTITVQRPRVRGLNERFESRVLPLFRRRTPQVDQLLPELYLHGLAEGDFDLALRGLLGEDAPISAASVARLKAVWQQEYDAWTQRSLAELDVVYLWVDGVYVKAGLERQKAALLVAIGALRDGRKVVLAVTPGVRESTESWSAVLRDLQRRGLNCPRLVIGDGHLGIWGALANVFPEAGEPRSTAGESSDPQHSGPHPEAALAPGEGAAAGGDVRADAGGGGAPAGRVREVV
jgi:transposase-like protein